MSVYQDILEILPEYSSYSNYVATWCPFDDHASPALMIYQDEDKPDGEGRYYCLSCSKGGTHAYLWKKLTGNTVASIPGAKKQQKFLPHWRRWEERYGSIEALVQKAHDNVINHPATHAWYLKKRDLMPLYEQCKLGYIDEWLIFPILDPQGKVLDVIARDSKGRSKYVIHSNDEDTPLLYVPNWDRVMQSKTIFIVYGMIDALALEMCGLPVVTGSTGKSLSNKRLIQLNKKYVIIPDRGEDDAARKLAKSLGNFTHIIRLPWSELGDNIKDTDDIRMRYGLDYLKDLLTKL
jgi:hypothetical protein